MAPDLGDIVDGCPPGLYLSEMDLQNDLDRRRPGNSRYTKQRREPDKVHILSGIFEGKITGTPIDLLIDDVNQRLKDHSENMYRFRPGHADFTPIIISMDCVIIELVGVARETAMRECHRKISDEMLQSDYSRLSIPAWPYPDRPD